MARAAGKSIVAVKLGQSEAGRNAAMAHTGSLAGSVEAFDAVAGEVGVIRADTLDDAVEITELLVHTGAPPGRRLGAVTLSGAYRGLLLDAAERNGLEFLALAPATTERLNAVLTVGSLVGNPIDGGFGVLSSADNFMASIDALQGDPNVDMVLVQEGAAARARRPTAPSTTSAWPTTTPPPRRPSRSPSSRRSRTARPITAARCGPRRRTSRSCRRPTRRCARSRASRAATNASGWHAPRGRRATADAGAARAHRALARPRARRSRSRSTRPESKDVLRAYGIATPAEALVTSRGRRDRGRRPHRLSRRAQGGVAHSSLHKSDIGAVALDLATPGATGGGL